MPAAYMKFGKKMKPPYAVYYGAGQESFTADGRPYTTRNIYTVEYYFIDKSLDKENDLEAAMIAAGFRYDKSEDVYIEDEKMNVIYYTVWRL